MRKVFLIVLLGIILIAVNSVKCAALDQLEIINATASLSYGSSYGPERAIDERETTYWLGAEDTRPWWIMFDAGDKNFVQHIKLTWFSPTYSPGNYDIQVSSDAITWEDAQTGLIGEYVSGGKVRLVERDARYIRIYVHEAYRFPCLRDFKAYTVVNVPRLIRFQGTLKDGSGMPLEGNFSISFKLYNVETGETAIWDEIQSEVSITEGLLDVELGSITPLELAFGEQYWLGIEIESDGEMTPRFKLTTVPYAFRARE